ARTAALLHHTNIVPVFGVGEHEGVPYYAMQYIQGRGLDVVLREVAGLRRDTPGRGGGADREPGGAEAATMRGPPPPGEPGPGRPRGRPRRRSRPRKAQDAPRPRRRRVG